MKIYLIGQKGIPVIYGGVERHVEELATRLADQGNEVFVYCRNYYTPKDLKEYKGVNLIHLPTIRTKHLDAIIHTLLASIDVLRRDVDIIHYHAIGPSAMLLIPRLLKRKAKVFSTFHSDDRKHQKWGWLARKCLGIGAYISVKYPHKTIAVSKDQRDIHTSEFGGNMTYIPNGVASYERITANLITQKWGLVTNEYIVAISRLIRHKGLHHLIRAYCAIKTDKKLVIVGDASYTNDYVKYLKELAGDNENIIFTGNQEGDVLAELYSNAYVYVQPSESEGFSIGLLEAMSYGKGVLCSDIKPNLEAITDIGLTFKNKNISDLKVKLEYLLNNQEEVREMGDKLKERVRQDYNWDNIVEKTVKLYHAALSDKKRLVKQVETN